VLFPLGELSKADVRKLAAQRGLPVSGREESQDICFIRDHDYRRFLGAHMPQAIRPGPIYDTQRHTIGEHKGLPFYTIGQREGLGISAPRPLYVMRLDVPHNALVVGFAEELGCRALVAEEMSYTSMQEPATTLAVEAKIRYHSPRVPAHVWALPGKRARVVFERPLRDIAAGQAVVLYQGEEVLGGGIISHPLEQHMAIC
jgi:tRNA-specific 2-thiouridylase